MRSVDLMAVKVLRAIGFGVDLDICQMRPIEYTLVILNQEKTVTDRVRIKYNS